MDEIKVYVIDKGRKNLYLRYLDPMTGKAVEKTAGTAKQADALKEAGKWQDELRSGRYAKPQRMTWEQFRQQFDRGYLAGMKPSTAAVYEASLNVFERKAGPGRLANVTTALVTEFAGELRRAGRSVATIARHLRTLKLAMRWAHKQGLLVKLPEFTMPKGAKGMKGRPITLEEFERMLRAVPRALKARPTVGIVDDVERLRFHLQGLWTSGLRLSESLALRWDDAPGALVVDFTGRRPMLRIPAESEKGNTHRLLPMAPEFAHCSIWSPRPRDAATCSSRPPAAPGQPGACVSVS